MNKKIENISDRFKLERFKNDKRVIVFAACLVIATALWFLNALGKHYSTTVSYPVKYVNPPKNQFLANKPPNAFELKVDAYGFTLLRHKLSLSFSPIVLNLSYITKNMESLSGSYTIYSRTLIDKIEDQVGSEIEITEILPESFTLVLDSLKTKSVPVKIDVTTEFKPQFNLKYPLSVSPREVKITGPSNVLDTILSVSTKHKTFSKLDLSLEKKIDLVHPHGVSINPEKVNLRIEVDRFTEKELKIPVRVINKPDSLNIKLFPSEIKVLFVIGLSEFDNIKDTDFDAVVDYNLITGETEKVKVFIQKKPGFVELSQISPENIEFLIETE